MKTIFIKTALLLFISVVTFIATGHAQQKDIASIIKKGAFLVDVRTPQEFAQGHVDGSVNIPVDQVQAQLDKFKNKKDIVVFCRSGNRSASAKAILDQNGIKNVYNGGTWEQVNAIKFPKK
jgi:rhodanese-related sulfurtransferase